MFQTIRKALREELEANDHRIGQGWISGASSLVLALAALLMVLGSRFPGIFTAEQLRKLQGMAWFDPALQAVLLAAFLLACTSMVLRQNKLLGLTSSFLVILSTFFGSFAFKSAATGGHMVLALDWFVLNLAITGALFLPLERLFRRTSMPIFRFEWRSDLPYFAISSMLVQPLTYLRFDIKAMKGILATPRFHHWRHGIEKEAIDVNFSIHFPILDKVFGTYHMPGKEWPSGYGVGGHPVPEGYLNQLKYPFIPSGKQAS